MGLIARLFGKNRAQPDMHALWHLVVAQARQPDWYARLGLADSQAGRFDAVSLVLAVVLIRMEQSPEMRAPMARLTELFVSDMDGQLRQEGVGDLGVGKRMAKLMSALGGRIDAYREGLAASDPAVLTDAVRRNMTLHDESTSAALADAVRALAARLAGSSDTDLLEGKIPQ